MKTIKLTVRSRVRFWRMWAAELTLPPMENFVSRGLQVQKNFFYDCILMDIRMPVMDGLTAARKSEDSIAVMRRR